MNIDNDAVEKVANHLYSLSDDCPDELRQGIATVRQMVNEEFVAKNKTIGSQTVWELLKPHINNLLGSQRQALRDELLSAIGENVTTHRSSCADGDMFTECDCGLGRMNQERDRIRTAISTIFEGKKKK